MDMTFNLDRFTNIREELDSQWSDDDIDEIMVMSPKDYPAPSPPSKPQERVGTSKGVADTTFSDFELLRDGVLDLSVSNSKVKLCKSRRTGEVYMMKSLQDCDQIVWSEEPNAPLPVASPVVTSCRLSRVPDKGDVFRYSSFPVSTEPPLRQISYPSALPPTICAPSSPPTNLAALAPPTVYVPPSPPRPIVAQRISTPLLPESTFPPVVKSADVLPNLSKFKYPSCPVIEEEVEVSTLALDEAPSLTLTPPRTLTLSSLLQDQPQLTAEERMDLFWDSIDREAAAVLAASPASLPLKWLKHRASVDALLNKGSSALSVPIRKLRSQKSAPGLQQIGSGIGFTYRVPAAAGSKSSVFTVSRGSVLRKLGGLRDSVPRLKVNGSRLRVYVPRLRMGRKKSSSALSSTMFSGDGMYPDDPFIRESSLDEGDEQDIIDIVNVYGDSEWAMVGSPVVGPRSPAMGVGSPAMGMDSPMVGMGSPMVDADASFGARLSPDPFRAMTSSSYASGSPSCFSGIPMTSSITPALSSSTTPALSSSTTPALSSMTPILSSMTPSSSNGPLMSPLSSSGPLTPRTPFGDGLGRGSYDGLMQGMYDGMKQGAYGGLKQGAYDGPRKAKSMDFDGLRLVTQPEAGLRQVVFAVEHC
ncbi:hypothetical protein K525DRAFT_248399 [Schizophyllum commune Loenen D]|nr:hypothetical protein K525DRAFT_248399 [Schizophyllum commune Loenen D]